MRIPKLSKSYIKSFGYKQFYYRNHLVRRAYSRCNLALNPRDLERIKTKLRKGYTRLAEENNKYLIHEVALGKSVIFAVVDKSSKRLVTFINSLDCKFSRSKELETDAFRFYKYVLKPQDLKQITKLVQSNRSLPCGKANDRYSVRQVNYNKISFLVEYDKRSHKVTAFLPPEMKCR